MSAIQQTWNVRIRAPPTSFHFSRAQAVATGRGIFPARSSPGLMTLALQFLPSYNAKPHCSERETRHGQARHIRFHSQAGEFHSNGGSASPHTGQSRN